LILRARFGCSTARPKNIGPAGWKIRRECLSRQLQPSSTTSTQRSNSCRANGEGALHQASYDYKAGGFTIPGDAHPMVVAWMNSYGSVSAQSGHNSSPGAVPGLPPAGHAGGGFGGSTSGGGGGHSGGGTSSGLGASHSGGGGSGASNAASSAASAGASSHH